MFDNLAAGSEHLAQVVTMAVSGQSLPVANKFSLPYAAPKSKEPTTNLGSAPSPVIRTPATAPTAPGAAAAPAATAPVDRTLSGQLVVVEAIYAGTDSPKECLSIMHNQVVIADGTGTTLAAATPSNPVMTDKDTSGPGFLANCTYNYSASVASRSIYKVTINGDLSSWKFTGFDPVGGEILDSTAVQSGKIKEILASLTIG
jgi:hypothetical protein